MWLMPLMFILAVAHVLFVLCMCRLGVWFWFFSSSLSSLLFKIDYYSLTIICLQFRMNPNVRKMFVSFCVIYDNVLYTTRVECVSFNILKQMIDRIRCDFVKYCANVSYACSFHNTIAYGYTEQQKKKQIIIILLQTILFFSCYWNQKTAKINFSQQFYLHCDLAMDKISEFHLLLLLLLCHATNTKLRCFSNQRYEQKN